MNSATNQSFNESANPRHNLETPDFIESAHQPADANGRTEIAVRLHRLRSRLVGIRSGTSSSRMPVGFREASSNLPLRLNPIS
jgi:hypothetical protein